MSNWRVTLKRLDTNTGLKTNRDFVKRAIASFLDDSAVAYHDLVGKIVEDDGVVIQFTGCRPIYAG